MSVKIIERRRFSRVSCNGDLPANMLRLSDGTKVHCVPIDAAPLGLGIFSPSDLSLDEHLSLAFPEHAIELKIAAKTHIEANKQWRYGLTPLAEGVDLEARFRQAGVLGTSQAVQQIKSIEDRAPRYSLDWHLTVEAKTLGTRTSYRLLIDNLSRSGLLVTTFEKEVAPFLINTLIDITLDPEKKHLQRPVHGFAKIVRRLVAADGNGSGKRISFGLLISEIFPEDKAVWESLLRNLERDADAAQRAKRA